MKHCKIALALFLIFVSTRTALAEQSAPSPFESRVHEGHLCPGNSAWASVRDFKVVVRSPGQPSAALELQLFDNHDMHAVFLEGFDFHADTSSPAEAFLIEGRALLTKNIQIEENYAIDVLDSTSLSLQVVMLLIDLAASEGPAKTSLPFHKEISETKYPIHLTTKSASGTFETPWHATVDLSPQGKEAMQYKIDFSFQSGGKKQTMQFEGTLANYAAKNRHAPVADDFSIAAWKQYKIGPYMKTTDQGTIYDYGTSFLPKSYDTVGALRKSLPKD